MTSIADMTLSSPVALNSISLRGSAQMVAEFFYYGVNSILYQRGVCAPDSFKRAQKYGTTILVTADDKLNNYFDRLLSQVEGWLVNGLLQKLIVVIANVETGDVIERWQFDVNLTEDTANDHNRSDGNDSSLSSKSERKIRQEIADVIRQITASVTFLPLLEVPCSFDVLLYADRNLSIPTAWSESVPSYVVNSREVQLRRFSTGLHEIATKVSYKECQ